MALTLAFEIHGYWISSPKATCLSAHGDTYLQVRACTIAITLADMSGRPNANLYIIRGGAEETNCDLHDASLDYQRAIALAPASKEASRLAMTAADVELEYCPRGQNADRAEAVVLSGALVALPYFLIVVTFIFGTLWVASRSLTSAVLLTLSVLSWPVAAFLVASAAVFLAVPFADYFPARLVREMRFQMSVIDPLWCILIAGWLTFFGLRAWPRRSAEASI